MTDELLAAFGREDAEHAAAVRAQDPDRATAARERALKVYKEIYERAARTSVEMVPRMTARYTRADETDWARVGEREIAEYAARKRHRTLNELREVLRDDAWARSRGFPDGVAAPPPPWLNRPDWKAAARAMTDDDIAWIDDQWQAARGPTPVAFWVKTEQIGSSNWEIGAAVAFVALCTAVTLWLVLSIA